MTLRSISFGEALIDEFDDRRVVAGAPLHVAAHLASLHWDSALVSRVGDDADGARVRRTLRDHHVDDRFVETDPDLPTGTVTVNVDGEGVPTFTIDRPVAWDAIVGPDPVPNHDAVCFGTLPMRDPRARGALERLLASSTGLRAGDANLRDPHWDGEAIELLVGSSDLLKLSDTELSTVSDHLDTTGDPGDLTLLGPEWVCVTRGAEGAELHHRSGGSWSVPGHAVTVVDTVGAGDAFLAGLVDGLVRNGDPEATLMAASMLAATVVARRGGLPVEPGGAPATSQ